MFSLFSAFRYLILRKTFLSQIYPRKLFSGKNRRENPILLLSLVEEKGHAKTNQ